ncbi:MAG: lysophospholipid acyltransferase family protein [Candidatus Sabulitectum sp.]|nr:lysophospholipid acyltransferase family protein [Candidatus Sabulitectum sp.]
MKASGLSTLYYRFIALSVKLAERGSRVERISNMVSSLHGAVSSSRNNLYNAHLKRIFPDMDDSWRSDILSGYWRMHERNLFALFYLRNRVYADLKGNVSWAGREHLDKAVVKGNGVLLLVPHFGDERSLHVILGMEGYPVDVITSRYSDLPEYVRKCRLETGKKWNNLHFPDENPRWMYRTLQGGRILHYAPTAYGGPGGSWITNFGVPVLVPSAPWKLHRRTGCQVIFAFCEQTPCMGFNLQFKPVDLPDDQTGFAEAIGKATEQLAVEYPSQYEWKTLLIRHRETNTIVRTGRIPSDESELEHLAEYADADPSRVLPLEGILSSNS